MRSTSVQPANAFSRSVTRALGSEIFFSAIQFINALSPIISILFENSTEESSRQFENADFGMEYLIDESLTDSSFSHP